mmetsp:Transcript_52813/g.123537  ORF Transcript_52813/g.123537 Transcript_52813/m.123537 type:complete len:218 (+) Transcript_52813:2603-3256(+)
MPGAMSKLAAEALWSMTLTAEAPLSILAPCTGGSRGLCPLGRPPKDCRVSTAIGTSLHSASSGDLPSCCEAARRGKTRTDDCVLKPALPKRGSCNALAAGCSHRISRLPASGCPFVDRKLAPRSCLAGAAGAKGKKITPCGDLDEGAGFFLRCPDVSRFSTPPFSAAFTKRPSRARKHCGPLASPPPALEGGGPSGAATVRSGNCHTSGGVMSSCTT